MRLYHAVLQRGSHFLLSPRNLRPSLAEYRVQRYSGSHHPMFGKWGLQITNRQGRAFILFLLAIPINFA